MLLKDILKISIITTSFFMLSACSTGLAQLENEKSDSTQLDKVTTCAINDSDDFYTGEVGANLLKVANQTYYFGFDKSTLDSKIISSLRIQADYLIAHPYAKILITGHTDERGSREYNIGLGQRRGASIANFLRSSGVNKNQMIIVSYGAEKPVAFGHSEVDYAKNRRANLQYQTPIAMDK